jgi:hypothetical protein
MTIWDDIGAVIRQYLSPLPSASTDRLQRALSDLEALVPTAEKEEGKMTTPNPVQIDQGDLDSFAASFEAVKTSLAGYIATLQANQAAPLSAADETGLNQALSDLQGLEPPAPSA